MEQNHELPSSFQETERCFYVCRSGCGRIAFRHRYPLTHFLVRTSYFISVMRNSRLCNGPEENTMTLDAPEPIAAYLAPKRRRTRTRFPAASPKTALSTTRGGIIAVVTRSANGSKRRTRNTDTFFRWSTRKRMEMSFLLVRRPP